MSQTPDDKPPMTNLLVSVCKAIVFPATTCAAFFAVCGFFLLGVPDSTTNKNICLTHLSNGSWTNRGWFWDIDSHNCGFSGLQNASSVCALLDRALDGRTMHIFGDSTSRRLAFTLRALIAGWPCATQWWPPTKDDEARRQRQCLPDRGPGHKHWLPLQYQANDLEVVGKAAGPVNAGDCSAATAIVYHNTPTLRQFKVELRKMGKANTNSTKRRGLVFVFSFGAWYLDDLSRLARAGDRFGEWLRELRAKDNDVWIWRTPSAVNFSHGPEQGGRWHEERPGLVRDALVRFGKSTCEEAMKAGIFCLDSLSVTLDAGKWVLFEDGDEWQPRQMGGIHMCDNGRRVVAEQLLALLSLL